MLGRWDRLNPVHVTIRPIRVNLQAASASTLPLRNAGVFNLTDQARLLRAVAATDVNYPANAQSRIQAAG